MIFIKSSKKFQLFVIKYFSNKNFHKLFLGLLKKEYSEGSILEIREYSLRLEKYKNETVKKIDEAFKKIINLLKNRKGNFSNEILEKFGEEKNKILFEEGRWIDKQEIAERLLNLLSEKSPTNLLINSKYIMEGIRILNEKQSFKEMKVFNDLETSLSFSKEINKQELNINLSVEDICSYFSEYINVKNPNVLEYKA